MKNIKLFVILLVPFIVFGQSPVLPEQKGRVLYAKVNSKNFSFAVLGDRTAGANQSVFEQTVDQIKSLNPDFVINVGDLIEGYSQSESIVNSEWNSIFTNISYLKEKFFFTPGNHDIWDTLSRRIFLSHTMLQKPYYAFSIGKNHFLVLDNSRQEKVDKPDSAQLVWLINELSKYKVNNNIFCFTHRSFWKDCYSTNKPDTFHKLFTKYGVDYVFSGHDHFYCQLVWDGITYTQVGPSGSRYKEFKKEEYGAFQNFVKVAVKNDRVDIKVLKPDGAELASDIVTYNGIKQLQEIESSITVTRAIVASNDSISVTIHNILESPISSQIVWNLANSHWQISPQTEPVDISGKGRNSYAFSSKIESESVYPLPQFSLSYPYAMGKKHYEVKKFLPIKLQAQCQRTEQTIEVDGRLNEKIWQKNKPLSVFGSGDGGVSQTDPWEVFFAYDDINFYIAAKMNEYEPDKIQTNIKERDEKVYSDDHLNIVVTPDLSSNTYYQFFVNSNGVVLDRICKMEGKDSKKDSKWNSNIVTRGEIFTGEKFSGWTLEMAIPLSDLNVKSLNETQNWGFNLVRFQSSKDKVSIYSVPFEHNPKTFASLKFVK